MSYQPKVYRKQGGDELVVAPGGALTVEAGGSLSVAGVTVDESTLAVNGLTASATELNEQVLTLDIADGSADATYYLVCPHAGTITKIWAVTDGAVSSADITITPRIVTTEMTSGVITIATAESAAGDIESSEPSAENVITAGAAINFVVAGGGSGGAPRIHLAVVLTRG
jgi:hypothetical protein